MENSSRDGNTRPLDLPLAKFCVETTVESTDEWLHSFYYFNDELPTEKDFDKTIGDYLSFEFSMIMQGRKYLFDGGDEDVAAK